MKRELTALAVAAMLALAGCGAQIGDSGGRTSTAPASDATERGSEGGTVRMYVSDERNAVGLFAHLNVTITEVGLRPAGVTASTNASADGATEANGTDDGSESAPSATATGSAAATGSADAGGDDEWQSYVVEERTVDLTELQGENATHLGDLTVPAGEYDGVFVRVSDVEATLKGGERVRVKLPSDRLRIEDGFAVGAASATDFVFDITVFEAGTSGKFVLKPVADESGTDQRVRLVETGRTINPSVNANANASASASTGTNVSAGVNGSVDTDGPGNATESIADGELDVSVREPPAPGASVAVSVTDGEGPVEAATVRVGGTVAGTTDAEGKVTVRLPDADRVRLSASAGGATAEATLSLDAGANGSVGASASGAVNA